MAYRPRSGPASRYGLSTTTRPTSRSRRGRVMGAAIVMAGWIALLWSLEIIDAVSGHVLDTFGITPRQPAELRDVVPAAFLHFGFDHLAANTGPLLVLGFLVALSGRRRLVTVATVIIVVSGLGVWLTAPAYSTTAGASGVIFGLLGYLLARGIVNRSVGDLAIGLLVSLVYGSILWGVLPTTPGVSWQGHLFGLIGGVTAAYGVRRAR